MYRDVLMGPVLALLAAAVVLTVGRLLRPRDGSGGWWGTAAVALGYVAGYYGMLGWPPFPAVDMKQRLCYLALACGVGGAVLALLNVAGAWRRAGFVAGLLGFGAAYLLLPRFGDGWSAEIAAAWVGGASLAAFAFWATLEDGAADGSGVWECLTVLLILAGTAALAVSRHSALLAQLAVVLAAALGPVLLAARFSPGAARGALAVVALVLPGLWLIGSLFSDFPTTNICLLAAAPAAASLARRLLPAGRLNLLRLALPLVLVGVSVALAVPEGEPADDSGPYQAWSPPAAPTSPAPKAPSPRPSAPTAPVGNDDPAPPDF